MFTRCCLLRQLADKSRHLFDAFGGLWSGVPGGVGKPPFHEILFFPAAIVVPAAPEDPVASVFAAKTDLVGSALQSRVEIIDKAFREVLPDVLRRMDRRKVGAGEEFFIDVAGLRSFQGRLLELVRPKVNCAPGSLPRNG